MSATPADTSPAPNSVLNQIVERVSDLYTLPAVALQVVQLTGEPKIDCRKLKECIENDPALTCKILKFVNSPIYGLRRQIADLQEALAIVGTNSLRLLVLGFSLPSNLLTGIEKTMLGHYWRFALTKGVAARELSRSLLKDQGDEAFIGGMLQNVGMLALIQELGTTYTTFLKRVWDEKDDLQRLEIASMGFDHTILSARLLDSWSLPSHLVKAVGVATQPSRVSKRDSADARLIKALHMSELTVKLFTSESEHALASLYEACKSYCPERVQKLEPTLESIEGQVNQLAELLDLELSDSTRYAEVLERARIRLNELAETSAIQEQSTDADTSVEPNATDEDHSEAATDEPPRINIDAALDNRASHAEPQSSEAQAVSTSDSQWGSEMLATEPVSLAQNAETTICEAPSSEPASPASTPELANILDDDLTLHLNASIARCRQQRQCIGLALLEIDGFDEKLVYLSPNQSSQLAHALNMVTQKMFSEENDVVRVCESRLGVILEDLDSEHASELLRRLIEGIRRWSKQRAENRQESLTISIGFASTGVPPKNFDCEILIERAERCLSAAQHFGGNTLKSIVF